MWQKFVSWLKSLFASVEPTVDDVAHLQGWIKDKPDARDQVFGEEK